jgi:hypothetical protein
MRWKTAGDFDRVSARYIRRRRSYERSVYCRLTKATVGLVAAALLVFVIVRYFFGYLQ